MCKRVQYILFLNLDASMHRHIFLASVILDIREFASMTIAGVKIKEIFNFPAQVLRKEILGKVSVVLIIWKVEDLSTEGPHPIVNS